MRGNDVVLYFEEQPGHLRQVTAGRLQPDNPPHSYAAGARVRRIPFAVDTDSQRTNAVDPFVGANE